MPRRRPPARTDEHPGSATRGLALALALAAASAAPGQVLAAGDLTARAELSYQADSNLGASDQYFRQVYLLQWQRQITDPITLRLRFRYQDDRGTLDTGERLYSLQARQIMPAATFEYRLDSFYQLLAWSRVDNQILDGSTGLWFLRAYQQLGLFGWFRPDPGLELSWYASQVTNEAVGLGNRDTRFGVGLTFTSGGFRLEATPRFQIYDDSEVGLTRNTLTPRLALMYNVDGGRQYSLSARYELEYYWVTLQTTRTGTGSVPSEILPVAGLYVVNPIPIDTTSTPMQPEPRLIDGNLEVSAGISLGPDGVSFQNLGLDMGRVTTLDQLRVAVRATGGQLVQFGGPVTWSAYWSQDGNRWIAIDAAAGRFDFGLSAYVVDFTPVPARYFKVVNFGLNTVETLVTELQPYVTGSVQADRKLQSHTVRQTFGLMGNWRPVEKLQLAYNGQFDTNSTAGFGDSPVWFSDLANQFNATIGPFSNFTFGAGVAANRLSQPGGYLQSSYFGTGYASYRPYDDMEVRLDGRYGVDQAAGFQTTTPTVALSGYANPYDSLRFSGSVSLSRQQIVDGGTTDYVGANAQAWIDPLRHVELRFDLSLQRTVQSSGDVSVQEIVPLFRIVNYERLTFYVRYRPSDQVDLLAGIGHTSSSQGSGITQSYVLRWYPFPNGTVHLDTEYRQEVDPLSGRSYWQLMVVPRWNVNRWMQLLVSFNKIQGTGGVPVSQQTLFAQLLLFI
jgi:hypothetical protein